MLPNKTNVGVQFDLSLNGSVTKSHVPGCHAQFFLFLCINLLKSPYCFNFPIIANLLLVAREKKKVSKQDLNPGPWNPPPLD